MQGEPKGSCILTFELEPMPCLISRKLVHIPIYDPEMRAGAEHDQDVEYLMAAEEAVGCFRIFHGVEHRSDGIENAAGNEPENRTWLQDGQNRTCGHEGEAACANIDHKTEPLGGMDPIDFEDDAAKSDRPYAREE